MQSLLKDIQVVRAKPFALLIVLLLVVLSIRIALQVYQFNALINATPELSQSSSETPLSTSVYQATEPDSHEVEKAVSPLVRKSPLESVREPTTERLIFFIATQQEERKYDPVFQELHIDPSTRQILLQQLLVRDLTHLDSGNVSNEAKEARQKAEATILNVLGDAGYERFKRVESSEQQIEKIKNLWAATGESITSGDVQQLRDLFRRAIQENNAAILTEAAIHPAENTFGQHKTRVLRKMAGLYQAQVALQKLIDKQ